MKLNTKTITRLTLRIYDCEFRSKLDDLLSKTNMTQQDFFMMLIREGYNNVYPRYTSGPSVNVNFKKEDDERLIESFNDLKELILASYQVEQRKLTDLNLTNKDLLNLLSCVYRMLLDGYSLDTQLEIESGKFDSLPIRFKKNRNVN